LSTLAMPPPERLVSTLLRPAMGLPVFVLAAGFVSLALGIDANWDLKNYHYYNPWALLHDRARVDLAPAGIQTFHNPLPDLPFYALITAGLPAWCIAFVMGVPAGIGAYFFFRIARLAVADLGIGREGLALLAICAVAFTATASLALVGSTMNEWQTAALVLAAVFLLVRELGARRGPRPAAFAAIGLLVGIAVGLKLAAAPYAFAVAVVTLISFANRPGRLRAFGALALSSLAGFALAYGYWAAVLESRYGNPFFPYFNALFGSEYWYRINFIDQRYRPHTLNHWLTWPVKLAERNRLMTEVDMREPRLAVLYFVTIGLFVSALVEARRARRPLWELVREQIPASVRAIALFTGSAYAFWVATSGIYRYTIPAELTASLLAVLGLRALLQGGTYRDYVVAIACVAIVAQTVVPSWGRVSERRGPYFDVRVPLVTPDALVISATEPVAYLVPFMPPGARLMRLLGPYQDDPFPHRFQKDMHAAVAAHAGPLFVLRWNDVVDPNEERMLAGYGLQRIDSQCAPVRTNVEVRRLDVCPLARLRAGRQGDGRSLS
jgi:hypothetical protein